MRTKTLSKQSLIFPFVKLMHFEPNLILMREIFFLIFHLPDNLQWRNPRGFITFIERPFKKVSGRKKRKGKKRKEKKRKETVERHFLNHVWIPKKSASLVCLHLKIQHWSVCTKFDFILIFCQKGKKTFKFLSNIPQRLNRDPVVLRDKRTGWGIRVT
jgi:hypothetical protein